MDRQLQGKTALVTGGSRGLGRAICLALAAEGARVVVNYQRGAEQAAEVVAEIARRHAREALAYGADVADESDVARLFDAAEARFGPVDVLVNNAAVCPTRWLVDLSLDEWSRTIAVNLTGTFLACREMARRGLFDHVGGGFRAGARDASSTSPQRRPSAARRPDTRPTTPPRAASSR